MSFLNKKEIKKEGKKIMDSVTSKFLKEFKTKFEIVDYDEDMAFEYFANYCCINKENGNVDISLDDISTGNAANGIDGIGIIVNHKLVTSVSEVEFQIQSANRLDVKFVFVQSKTSPSFENALILNFFEFTKAFFNEEEYEPNTREMENFFEIKQYIYEHAEYLVDANPQLSMYYVTTGKWMSDRILTKVIDRNCKELKSLNILSEIKFEPCGASEIQALYRNTKNDIVAKFKFDKNIVMFGDEDSKSIGYIGVIPFSEFKKIIIGEGDVLKQVFDDNIRDFLGNRNPVNKAITDTLRKLDVNSFCMLNNGITIIANKMIVTGTTFVITDYQIVNGCQTSHVLYDNRNIEGIDSVLIPVKLIGTEVDEIRNEITKATNSQTSIRPEQLEALSDFQKNLEEYYTTKEGDGRLFYERRTGQYRLENISKTRIITIPDQIKAVSAMFLDNPHGVSGNYGKIVNAVGNRIFNPDDKKIVYYTSAFAKYKVERLISEGVIDRKYNKSRYHAMMLFRIIVAGKACPAFRSKKMDKYCEKIVSVLNDEDKCSYLLTLIVDFIISQKEIDLEDRKTFERKETTELLLGRIDKLREYIKDNSKL